MKKFRAAIAMLLAIVMAISSGVNAFAAGPKYIEEVRLSYGDTAEEAKSWLIENGYTVLDHDLNDGTGKQYVYLGYRATNDKNKAITDMAIMDMKGGYSFGDYEKMLEEREAEIQATIHYFQATVKEFAANYKNGDNASVSAFGMLNRFYEDDSGLGLGEFLTTYVDDAGQLTKLFMQSNQSVMSFMFYLLALGCTDSSETGNWLYKFSQVDPYDYYDPVDYDETARSIFANWDELRDQLLSYDETAQTVEEYGGIEEYSKNVSLEELSSTTDSLTLHDVLDSFEYDGESMLEFFLRDPDEIDISELYPLASVMTVGQTECARYLGLGQLVKLAVSTEETVQNYEDAIGNITEATGATETYSVYTGIDRTLFEGGVALTNDALRESASNADNSWISGNVDKDIELKVHIIAGSTLVGGCILAASFAKISTVAKASAFAVENAALGAEFASSIAWQNNFSAALTKSNALMKASSRLSTISGVLFGLSIGVSLLLEAVLIGVELYNYYHPEYTEIPRILVDQKIVDEENEYVVYYAVMEKDHSFGDLNAFQGKQWNALYTTKDKNAGNPITTDMLVVKGDSATKDGYNAVHYFGASNAFNLNSHTYKDKVNGIYLYAKQDHNASLTASAFSTEMTVLYIGVGLILGLAVGSLSAIAVIKRRKNKVLVN